LGARRHPIQSRTTQKLRPEIRSRNWRVSRLTKLFFVESGTGCERFGIGQSFSMKTTVVEQFLTDAKGRRTGVLLNLDTYERLREAEEELADIHAYDSLQDRAHSEIAAGQGATLNTYRARRGRKGK
jgi:hypothetical protein